jgi:hypothetical protein
MNPKNINSVETELKLKYKEEVQSYTSYAIGRKISANTNKFTE